VSAPSGDHAAALAALASELGADAVREAGPGDLVDGVAPFAVVRPADAEQARRAVAIAVRGGIALVASGLGRHLSIGAPPRHLGLLLRMDRVDRVVEHHAADMTVTVEAGCTLAALDERLRRAGQWLPLDPPAPAETTVGGLVAANLAGPLRASQGGVRDLLLGIETVSGEGVVVRGGGRVVKNVAGYDLPRLHVGALGSLGVVLAATFKTVPVPPGEGAVEVEVASPREACDLALALRDAFEPAWLELVAEAGGPATRVVFGCAGLPPEVACGLLRARTETEARGHRAVEVEDATALRARLAEFPLREAAAILRVSTLPDRTGLALESLARAARDCGVRAPLSAQVASGIARAAIADAVAVAPVLRALRARREDPDAAVVVERASAEVKPRLVGDADPWGDPGESLALVRGVKRALDPGGILSPGRLPGGV